MRSCKVVKCMSILAGKEGLRMTCADLGHEMYNIILVDKHGGWLDWKSLLRSEGKEPQNHRNLPPILANSPKLIICGVASDYWGTARCWCGALAMRPMRLPGNCRSLPRIASRMVRFWNPPRCLGMIFLEAAIFHRKHVSNTSSPNVSMGVDIGDWKARQDTTKRCIW